MSYDISVGSESFNYTSNLGKLFYDHIPDNGKGGGLKEIHGLTGTAAVDVLSLFLENLQSARLADHTASAVAADKRFSAIYDAPNGWGSTLGAVIFAAQVMAACAKNPDAIVDLWY